MKYFKNLLVWIFAAATFSIFAQSVPLEANQCRPEVIKRPTVIGMAVIGELSGFNPCHPSVSFRIPASLANSKKPPLVIAVHGGSGRSDAEAITNAFFTNGMATLIFDAYKHNGVPPLASNAYRQMMLYKVALQAYQWALTRQDVDVQRIYLYGISNVSGLLTPSFP